MAKLPVEKLKASKTTKPVPVSIVNDVPKDRDGERERKWKAEDALRDIERAEGHKRDKSLMSDVKKVAKAKMDTLSKVCK